MADFTRGIPTDCSMNFSLMLQLAPMMASMECLLKVLKFVGAIVGILKSFRSPDGRRRRPQRRGRSGQMPRDRRPAGPICAFVKDLLLLISTMILCVVKELDSILEILERPPTADLHRRSGRQHRPRSARSNARSRTRRPPPTAPCSRCSRSSCCCRSPERSSSSQAPPSTSRPSPPPCLRTILQAMQTLLEDLGEVATVIKEVAEALPC